MKTIKELSEATGISRFTLANAAKNGRLGAATHPVRELRGIVYIIDDEHEDFKRWYLAHEVQPRVRGRAKQREQANKPEGDDNEQ